MADSNTWLLLGIGVGLGIGIGACILWQRRQAGTVQPGLTVHEVHRDSDGRIQSVETFRGIGEGGISQRPPMMERADGSR